MKRYLPLCFLLLPLLNACVNENSKAGSTFEGLSETTLAQKKISDLGFEIRFVDFAENNGGEIQDLSLLLRVTDIGRGQTPLKYNLSGDAEYGERITYFSFAIQNDLKLVLQGDTISCAVHHFVRKYDLAPYMDIVAIFPVRNSSLIKGKTIPATFIYNDRIFNTGRVSMGITIPAHKPKRG